MHELDRIFDRDDVVGAIFIDEIDERGQVDDFRNRPVRSPAPALMKRGEARQRSRQPKLIERGGLEWNGAEDRVDTSSLPIDHCRESGRRWRWYRRNPDRCERQRRRALPVSESPR